MDRRRAWTLRMMRAMASSEWAPMPRHRSSASVIRVPTRSQRRRSYSMSPDMWTPCAMSSGSPIRPAIDQPAAAPKSKRVGTAYWAAMADVQEHGSQPVPPHLLMAGHPAMRRHGIGVGYLYPHDYQGADVEQQ
jgi:MgsA AAA+ ATPase C terminal